MKTIFKYTLKPGTTTLQLPIDAVPLSAGVQGEEVMLWVQVDTDNVTEPRNFEVYGTGHTMLANVKHTFIQTIFMDTFVFHVFEVSYP